MAGKNRTRFAWAWKTILKGIFSGGIAFPVESQRSSRITQKDAYQRRRQPPSRLPSVSIRVICGPSTSSPFFPNGFQLNDDFPIPETVEGFLGLNHGVQGPHPDYRSARLFTGFNPPCATPGSCPGKPDDGRSVPPASGAGIPPKAPCRSHKPGPAPTRTPSAAVVVFSLHDEEQYNHE